MLRRTGPALLRLCGILAATAVVAVACRDRTPTQAVTVVTTRASVCPIGCCPGDPPNPICNPAHLELLSDQGANIFVNVGDTVVFTARTDIPPISFAITGYSFVPLPVTMASRTGGRSGISRSIKAVLPRGVKPSALPSRRSAFRRSTQLLPGVTSCRTSTDSVCFDVFTTSGYEIVSASVNGQARRDSLLVTVAIPTVRTISLTPASRDTLRPSIPTITTGICGVGARPSSRTYSVRVQDATGGTVVPVVNQPVSLSLAAIPFSGGHNHAAGRPTGSFDSRGSVVMLTAVTDSSGKASFVYYPPRASGRYVIGAATEGASDTSDSVTVGFKGLVPFVQTLHDTLFGQTTTHPANHFGTPTLAQGISQLADAFFRRTRSLLFVNDVSLEAGGLFDIGASWTNPHCSHLDGVAADVRMVGLSKRDSLFIVTTWEQMMGDSTVVNEGDPKHFHLKIHR